MKSLVLIAGLCIASFAVQAQTPSKKLSTPDPAKPVQTVEVSCGECQFGMKGKTCDLAVRIDGKSYFVDGTTIDSHGNAHKKDGFCNAIRKAEVQGTVVKDRFVVSYFKLLPEEKKKG